MIRLLDIRVEETDIETSNIPEVRTYNIISGMMSDDCKPFRIAQSAMIWMTEDGYIGEIECIYPIEVDANMCLFKETINRCDGIRITVLQYGLQNAKRLTPRLYINN